MNNQKKFNDDVKTFCFHSVNYEWKVVSDPYGKIHCIANKKTNDSFSAYFPVTIGDLLKEVVIYGRHFTIPSKLYLYQELGYQLALLNEGALIFIPFTQYDHYCQNKMNDARLILNDRLSSIEQEESYSEELDKFCVSWDMYLEILLLSPFIREDFWVEVELSDGQKEIIEIKERKALYKVKSSNFSGLYKL